MTQPDFFLRTFLCAAAALGGLSAIQQNPAHPPAHPPAAPASKPASRPASAPAALRVGDAAPAFALKDHAGKLWKLADLKGKRVVLWFYPKASTSGCTVEACGFRDKYSEFEKQNVVILGVSFDGEEDNAKFHKNQNLTFPLLCDITKETALAYGAWTEGGMPYASRKSFVIGADGKLEHIFPKVNPSVHADELLKLFAGAEKK